MSNLLELTSLSKYYLDGNDRVMALRHVDLTVHVGELTALQGPSGSGKSTLLNICGLLDRHTDGKLLFEGKSVSAMSDAQLTQIRRHKIGFVFQEFNLIPVMNVVENIEYPLLLNGVSATQRRKQVNTLLERVGLAAHARKLPDHLSGGQRQRVAVARTLIKNPPLVIADEPTANLDSATATQVIDLMHSLGEEYGTTFLIATHDVRMAQRCNRIIYLEDGTLRCAG